MKSSHRRRPTSNECGLAVVAIVAIAGCASAQPQTGQTAAAQSRTRPPPADAPVAPVAPEAAAPEPLERFLENVDTLTADFEQRVYSAAGSLIERSAGTMALDRPGRFRWHYAPPDEFLLWADGEWLNMYEFDLEQHTLSPLEDAAANPLSLLSGDDDFSDVFDVVGRYSEDGLDWIELEPVGDTNDIASLVIGFGDDAPRRIEFVDSTDQLTRIDLTNLAVNAALPAGLFEFDVPEGATVLGGE